MKVRDFQKAFEEIVPAALAWKNDNVGLLIGSSNSTIKNILLSLDATIDVGHEAIRKKANLVVTHHPLLFHPLRSLTEDTRRGSIARFYAAHELNLFAAHTNLDSIQGGVSFALAEKLGLRNGRVLSPIEESLSKIVVFVPPGYVEALAKAMHDAGGGTFSKYVDCSFRSEGTGTFRGTDRAKPFTGTIGVLERAQEVRFEVLAETWKIPAILSAMRRHHPYEEIAYDVYPLLNKNTEYGMGAVGDLPKKMTCEDFLKFVKKQLKLQQLRWTGSTRRMVQRIAVCGGAGMQNVGDAVRSDADAYITGDISYHAFQDLEHDLLVIDAGHFETEIHVLPALAATVRTLLRKGKSTAKVFITEQNTNPIHYM